MTEPISENQNPPHANGNPERQLDNPNLQVSTTIAEPYPKYAKPQRIKRDWFDYGKAFLEIVGLIVVCIYTAYTIKIARANKQSADAATVASQAATDSLNETRKQFQQDQRPYISIVDYAISDIKTHKSSPPVIGKPLVVTISFRNTGKSRAINTIPHRHILFGSHLNDFKIEPADSNRVGNTIDPGAKPIFTTAISVRDTFQNESFRVDPNDIINWDGSKPIIVFGRVSYEDIVGNFYCLPYAVSRLQDGSWLDLNNWAGRSVSDLCPTAKP